MDNNNTSPIWVDTPAAAESAMEQIIQSTVAGYDSEFEGVDLSAESCVGKSKLDVFSIAVPTKTLKPLGYFEPRAWVFEGNLIRESSVKSYLEDGTYRKVIHNRPVDEHTAFNAGVCIRGGLCTLNMARFIYPERANLIRGNYDLDSLCRWRVDRGKTEDFDDLLGYDDWEPYECDAEANYCLACEDFGCRKKKPPHDNKVKRIRTVTRNKKVRRIRNLADIRPGHELFERYKIYAAVDAELALILYQMMLIDGQKERWYPWGL